MRRRCPRIAPATAPSTAPANGSLTLSRPRAYRTTSRTLAGGPLRGRANRVRREVCEYLEERCDVASLVAECPRHREQLIRGRSGRQRAAQPPCGPEREHDVLLHHTDVEPGL